MRLLHLTLVAALLAGHPAAAQSTAETMLATARQMRASAEQLRGKLPDADIEGMLRQADEIEASVRGGEFADAPAPPKEASLADRLLAQHGRLDWLSGQAACDGYTQENYRTFRYSSAINDRDTHCRNAHGHWATYARLAKDPQQAEGAAQALFYYDAAARRAVDHVGGR